MKRILCLMLVVVMMLSLVACGGGGSTSGGKNNGGSSQQDPAQQDSKEETYQKAMKLMEEKNFDEAVNLFESLGDYKDSKEMVKECKYRKANQMIAGNQYELAYNLLSQIKDYKDSAEMLTHFVWKHQKALNNREEGLFNNYTYTYDEHGYAISSSYQSHNMENSYTYVNEYDDFGRIKRITSTSNVGYKTIINYIYNEKGQLSCLSSNYDDAYVQDIFYYYNDLGQVIREEVPDTESITAYTYDEHGNVLTSDGNGGTFTYENTYDSNDRLVKYVRTNGYFSITSELTYDEHGNIMKEVSSSEEGFLESWEYTDFKLFYQP